MSRIENGVLDSTKVTTDRLHPTNAALLVDQYINSEDVAAHVLPSSVSNYTINFHVKGGIFLRRPGENNTVCDGSNRGYKNFVGCNN